MPDRYLASTCRHMCAFLPWTYIYVYTHTHNLLKTLCRILATAILRDSSYLRSDLGFILASKYLRWLWMFMDHNRRNSGKGGWGLGWSFHVRGVVWQTVETEPQVYRQLSQAAVGSIADWTCDGICVVTTYWVHYTSPLPHTPKWRAERARTKKLNQQYVDSIQEKCIICC